MESTLAAVWEEPMTSREELITPEILTSEFYRDIFGFAYRLAGNEPDALDLTQETFANVFRALKSGSDIANPKAYLITTLKNLFFRNLKKKKSEESFENYEIFIAAEGEELPPDPKEVDGDTVQKAINSLEEHYRLPLVMFYYNESSYEQIAEMLEIPIGTVMSRLARAKKYLKLKLASFKGSEVA